MSGQWGALYSQRLLFNPGTLFDDLEWHHIAASYNSGNAYLYIDGRVKASIYMSSNTTISTNNLDVVIGNDFQGEIDEVRLWSAYADESDIRNKMNLRIDNPGDWTTLEAYYHMDENGGTSVADATSNDNDGAFSGSPSWITSYVPLANKVNVDVGLTGTGLSPHIEETADVPIDAYWQDDNPGGGTTIAALQIDQASTVTTGLPTYYPSIYWELWMQQETTPYESDTRFHYDDIAGISDETTLQLFSRAQSGDSWTEVSSYSIVSNDGGSSTTTDGIGYIQTSVTNAIGFNKQYIIASSDNTLPVNLSTFTTQFIENTPTLYWSTQSEVDNLGWNIYRNNKEEFTSSQKITDELIPGHGTVSEPQHYIYEDQDVLNIDQTYYYWLESIDYSGISKVYNKVAHITIPDPSVIPSNIEPPIVYDLKVVPNPTSARSHFYFTCDQAGVASISVYNVKGELIHESQKVLTEPDEQTEIQWNLHEKENGIYFYQLKLNGKTVDTKRLILLR